MKKLLSLLSVGMVATAAMLAASDYVSRGLEASPKHPEQQKRGVRIPAGVLKRHNVPVANGAIPELTADRKTTSRSMPGKAGKRLPAKAQVKASSLQGYCIYSGNAGDIGWYDINLPSSYSLKWKRQGKFSPATGFVRGDEVYSFYQYANNYSGLTDAGLEILDLSSGAVKASYPYDIYDTLEHVTVLSAYDSESDLAYVATLDKTGSGSYMLQQFDPKTRSYTSLGVNVPANWLDMAWNPSDKSLYLFDEDGALKKFDAKAKRFSQVNSVSWELTDYPHDMVYSPKDNAFIVMVDSYGDDDYPCTDVLLMPVSGAASYIGTLPGNPQYGILNVSDAYVNADGAKAPELTAWNVKDASLQGDFTVRLPSSYENGSAIKGQVYLQVRMDDAEIKGAFSGAPGASVTIAVNGTEGLHRFSVTPYTLSDDGRVLGTPLVFDKCLGADVPAAPAGVTLSENKVTWNAVTAGANDGYVNLSDIRYNVYVDKVLMNSAPVAATSLDIVMPSSGAVAHRAEVYALCGGKISEPGVSGKYYAEGALSLPVFIGLEDGESDLDDDLIAMFTPVKDALNTDDLRGWRYDDQNEHTGGFYCLCPKASTSGETASEWLFLPAINFSDKNAHYRFSMDVWTANHYFTTPEIYEVALCRRPSPSRAVTIKDASTVYKSPYFEKSETLFQVPEEGEWYIGIRYVSPIGSYRLYARNFRVEKANASADSPAAVSDLRAKAAEKGELKATLSFKMPLLSVSGTALAESEVITAKAVSEAGEGVVTGAPGQTVSVIVPTKQGDNIISVTTSSDKGEGLLSETTVYCGVYRPVTPGVAVSVSDDNMTMTLDITPEELNDKGEYAGPADQEITIYRKIGQEWRPAAEIGKSRTWTFNCPDNKQELYMFGVGAKNAAGSCEEMFSFPVHLGQVHQLPMTEPFYCEGDVVKFAYEPLSIEHISYLQSSWGVTDPVECDESAANASGNALAAVYDGESQLLLPRFSTLGKHNVKIDLSLFFGNLAPESVTVLASSPAQQMTELAVFTPESGRGWEHKLVSLPSSCQNQGWVQVYIRVKIVGYSQCFLMESYSIADYPAEMVTITGFKGATRVAVGEEAVYDVELENVGTEDVNMPGFAFKAMGADGEIPYSSSNNVPAVIAAGSKVYMSFAINPDAGDMGDANVSFSIEGQPEVSVSKVEKSVKVLNARIPVVQDLALEYGETKSEVVLKWSKPAYVEDFEVAEPWDYSDEIRGFRNIDLDKSKEWPISEVNFPGEGLPKAFQVFTSTLTDNPMFAAHRGEQYLLCLSPKTGETDEWLISPEVKGGSKLSFWMNLLADGFPETVLIKYSTTGNNPEDFTHDVNKGYVCPEESGWKKYEFTLPADARYFAIHHIGDDGNEQFGFMIDDIVFEPVSNAPAVEGYNVYRDGEIIASNLTEPGYADRDIDTTMPMRYYVKTISTVKDVKMESDRSNVVWSTDLSGLEDVDATSSMISAGKGFVELKGFATGTLYTVSDVSGKVVASANVTSDVETIRLAKGVYVVKCGSHVAKVIVK